MSNSTYNSTSEGHEPGFDQTVPMDLLRLRLIGTFLAWRHSRTVLQVPLLILSLIMIGHGLLGTQISPKNFATVLSWVYFRGALVLTLIAAGNFFCLTCPFMLVRNGMRKIVSPRFNWPRRLRNKWISIGLFILVLFSYELFGLWSSPWWTAWLIVIYFVAVLLIDGLFKHATFCKFICPIGQFNFLAATLSPFEVTVREPSVCTSCKTNDCIRGRRSPTDGLTVVQRGCELALFQPSKVGNMDCTFCLDCVHACPHENVGILSRLPAAELMTDPNRSGIGRFSRRPDIAALSIAFTFGAILNAFAMVTPVYRFENWLAKALGLGTNLFVLSALFITFLLLAPALLLGLAASVSSALAAAPGTLRSLLTRYSFSFAPLGLGMWLAHYSYHFLTGLYTIIPVTQSALLSAGYSFLGTPRWALTGLSKSFVEPLEFGFLLLGLAGSLTVAYHLAREDSSSKPWRPFLPWAAVFVFLWAVSVWLVQQPMDMRATFMSG